MSNKQVDTSLMDSKQYKKAEKLSGDTFAKEILNMDEASLDKKIVDCEMYEQQVNSELRATPAYQKAKETVSDFAAGARETLAPIKATKALCVAVKRSRKDHK